MPIVGGWNGSTAMPSAANGAESRYVMPPVPHRYARAPVKAQRSASRW